MNRKVLALACAAFVAVCVFLSSHTAIGAEGDKVISDFMKKYHKAPQGTDPVCKKAGAGTATDAELSDLLKGYEAISAVKPPKGDEADWTKKTQALVAAVKQLQAKDAGGPAAYKAAVNCKACHEAHKPAK
jgi:hypothetical protein